VRLKRWIEPQRPSDTGEPARPPVFPFTHSGGALNYVRTALLRTVGDNPSGVFVSVIDRQGAKAMKRRPQCLGGGGAFRAAPGFTVGRRLARLRRRGSRGRR